MKAHPPLRDVLDKKWVPGPGSSIASVGRSDAYKGVFTSFAKNAAWGDDLWANLIGPHYQSDLMVETWIRGHKLGSYCRPKHKLEVVDVKSMKTGW